MIDFDYPAFLAARLDELEEISQEFWARPMPETHKYFRADIEAKRAILELHRHEHQEATQDYDQTEAMDEVVKLLSRPFKDHPDYPKEEQ